MAFCAPELSVRDYILINFREWKVTDVAAYGREEVGFTLVGMDSTPQLFLNLLSGQLIARKRRSGG